MFSKTCIAPVNIAIIKYWGKRDEDLILPINDSISMTLSTEQLRTKTTIAASAAFENDRMWLNGEEVAFKEQRRLMRCYEKVKELASKNTTFPLEWKIHVCSENNFPTAAGLASSAAGYACFVYALAKLYDIKSDLTKIARLGSGSACRSLHGGFVQWVKGELASGNDSLAFQVQPSIHWPDMRVLILVVNDLQKKTSSTKGMLQSVLTSDMIKYRSDICVPLKIVKLKEAICKKNFSDFAEITMRDSNQFHAICLDTYPPCVYMNTVSHLISEFVHNFNEFSKEITIGYSFDAGPNACLFILEKNIATVFTALSKAFPNDNASSAEYIKGLPIDSKSEDEIVHKINFMGKNAFKYIIHTKIGEGPEIISDAQSLLDENGYPI